jgi:serine/threonine-protein kinase
MAVVWEARHAALGKRVAIKVTRARAFDDDAVARFLREGRAVARIQHPHVIEIFDFGVHEGAPYLAMPLLEGVDLATYLRTKGPLPLEELVAILLPVISGVAAAHAADVVHRDLKPGNLFLASRRAGPPQPIVLDFGISKPADDGPGDLTGSDVVLGTAHYMAPEQIRAAKRADARSDQYSLGVILYQCATGERPFEGEDSYALMHAVMNEPLVPPSELRPELPAAFDRVVLRALSRDPAERFASVHDLGCALLPFASPATREAWGAEFRVVAREASTPSALAADVVPAAGETFRDERAGAGPAARRAGRTFGSLAAAGVVVSGGLLLAARGGALRAPSTPVTAPAVAADTQASSPSEIAAVVSARPAPAPAPAPSEVAVVGPAAPRADVSPQVSRAAPSGGSRPASPPERRSKSPVPPVGPVGSDTPAAPPPAPSAAKPSVGLNGAPIIPD